MKKILVKFLIFIVCIYIFQCSCFSAQTNPNYSVTAIQIYNAGVALHKQGKYELAEQKYNQALKIQPNFAEVKNNLLIIYQIRALNYYNEKAYENAILFSQKALMFKPNSIDLYRIIAQSYTDLKDCKNAYNYYKKILLINPNDAIAQQNFQIIKYYYTEDTLNNQLNNIKVECNAPDTLYALIKPSIGGSDEEIKNMKNILDMIWSEPNGQILLQALIENKIPINLTQENIKANAARLGDTGRTIAVNIPIKRVKDFNDKNLTTYLRVYNLQVFVHEFGHAFIGLKCYNDVNSLEEELGVSMIGYNVALKVITGRYMDKGQTQIYSFDCLKNFLFPVD